MSTCLRSPALAGPTTYDQLDHPRATTFWVAFLEGGVEAVEGLISQPALLKERIGFQYPSSCGDLY
jgi:hypothetical protein